MHRPWVSTKGPKAIAGMYFRTIIKLERKDENRWACWRRMPRERPEQPRRRVVQVPRDLPCAYRRHLSFHYCDRYFSLIGCATSTGDATRYRFKLPYSPFDRPQASIQVLDSPHAIRARFANVSSKNVDQFQGLNPQILP